MITVHGRVRATVRLRAEASDASDAADAGDATRVLASSWSSARDFPRTAAAGVVFEVETADGDVYAVDPFEALVAVPVKRRASTGDAHLEEGWIAHGDELDIDGEIVKGRGHARGTLRALRISASGPGAVHRVPPRSVARGVSENVEKIEKVEAKAPEAPVTETTPAEATDETPARENDGEPATVEASPPGAPRRPKKKRPDSSGTPTPVQ